MADKQPEVPEISMDRQLYEGYEIPLPLKLAWSVFTVWALYYLIRFMVTDLMARL